MKQHTIKIKFKKRRKSVGHSAKRKDFALQVRYRVDVREMNLGKMWGLLRQTREDSEQANNVFRGDYVGSRV